MRPTDQIPNPRGVQRFENSSRSRDTAFPSCGKGTLQAIVYRCDPFFRGQLLPPEARVFLDCLGDREHGDAPRTPSRVRLALSLDPGRHTWILLASDDDARDGHEKLELRDVSVGVSGA